MSELCYAQPSLGHAALGTASQIHSCSNSDGAKCPGFSSGTGQIKVVCSGAAWGCGLQCSQDTPASTIPSARAAGLAKMGQKVPDLLSLQKDTKNLTGKKTSALSHHLELLQKPQRNIRDLAEKEDKTQPDTLGPECSAGPWRQGKDSERRYIISSDVLHLSFSLRNSFESIHYAGNCQYLEGQLPFSFSCW